MNHLNIFPLVLFSLISARAEVAVAPSRPGVPAAPVAPAPVPSGPVTPAAPSPGPVEVNNDYELRGFFGTGDMLEISISKKGTAVSDWIPVGRKRGPVTVVSASPKDGTAIVQIGGKRSLLRLSSAKYDGAAVAESSKVTRADLMEAREYMNSLQERFTEEQMAVFTSSVGQGIAQDEKLNAASDRMVRGIMPTKAELEYQNARLPYLFADAVAKAIKLPDKDGIVHPMPRSLERVFGSPDAMKLLDSEDASAALPEK